MTNKTLDADSLREIGAIIDRLERSRFNYLDMQIGELRITVGDRPRGASDDGGPGSPAVHDAAGQARSAAQGMTAAAPATVSAIAPAAVSATVQATAAAGAAEAGPGVAAHVGPGRRGTPVRAPMIGRYYAQPEPGAAPFVAVGDEISPETTVGLIEVMKVFQAVTAGVAGTVLEIAVQDGQMVEFDQPILFVDPR